MASTKTVTSTRSLVRQEVLQFIREQNILLKIRGARPNTRLYVFFEEENVTSRCFSTGSDICITDENGDTDINMFIPGGVYTVGIKQIIVADTDNVFLINVPGTVNGSARGTFAAAGRIDFYQTTETTTINTVIQDIVYNHLNNNQNSIQVGPAQMMPEEPFTPPTYSVGLERIQSLLGGTITYAEISNLIQLGKGTVSPNKGSTWGPVSDGTFSDLEYIQGRNGVPEAGVPYGGIWDRSSIGSSPYTFLPQSVVTDQEIVDFFEAQLKQCKTQDPLAQSFFTYGIPGGFFLTGVEVFFATKDASVPVRMEIRPMVNGYPSDLSPGNPNLISIVPADRVTTSENASAATLFAFDPPIYLAEDKDYCFVLLSNSNKYNVFTSQMGELSIENNRAILEQPFIGSLFKSENNVTWTAYQYEDIKFRMYQAEFDISQPAVIDLEAVVPPSASSGVQFYTTTGSSTIYYVSQRQHGLQVGDKIAINALPSLTYNGISGADLSGEFDVTDVKDENILGFETKNGAVANVDGRIIYGDGIVKVHIINGGINYQAANTTITFSSGNATAVPIIENGKIVEVQITNMGTGYTAPPQVIVTSPTGSNASLIAVLDAMFTVHVNKNMTSFSPNIKVLNYGDTYNRNFAKTTIGNYIGGSLTSYGAGSEFEFSDKAGSINMPTHSLIASRHNEAFRMNNQPSLNVKLELYSNNKNVSPFFDTRSIPQIFAYETSINDQPGEDRTSTNSTASIDSLTITGAGSGYSVTPAIEFIGGGGSGAAATVTLVGGQIATVTLTSPGSGYTRPPLVRVVPGEGDISGQGGAIRAFLTPFNSELLPTGGNARSRYVTRKINLATISTGMRLFSTISSGSTTNVDWYVRTSLSTSGVNHDEQEWKRLECPVERNRSSSAGEYYEYLFELNNLSEFDTYDLKCVMLSDNPINTPFVSGYRVIVVA